MRALGSSSNWSVRVDLRVAFVPVKGSSRPAGRELLQLVEAGGQLLHGFRHGLDYAFIHGGQRTRGCGACYPVSTVHRILVPTPGSSAVGEPMSLYRAGLKLAFFLPLGVAMPPSRSRTPSGFADVSSVLIRTSRPGATL